MPIANGVFLFQLLLEAYAAFCIIRLHILPTVYLALVMALLVIFAGISAALLYSGMNKEPGSGKRVRRIFGILLALVISAGSVFASGLFTDLESTMQAITSADGNESLVKAANGTETVDPGAPGSEAVTAGSAEEEKKPSNVDEFGDPIVAAEAKRSADEVWVKNAVNDVENDPFIFYISGSDGRSTNLEIGRSDVNILVVVNPATKQVLLVNTPRDYYVANPMGDGEMDKLTHCSLYGLECSIGALEALYNTNVNYYAQINFTGFETLIDAIGGITVNSVEAFVGDGGHVIKEGINELNGAQALSFARERYHVEGGDNGRGRNQMRVITAVIEKMTSGTTILENYSDILKSLQGMFVTSIDQKQISALVRMQLGDNASWNVKSYAVVGTGSNGPTYSIPGMTSYVMIPDEDSVNKGQDLIQKVLAGETITDSMIEG